MIASFDEKLNKVKIPPANLKTSPPLLLMA